MTTQGDLFPSGITKRLSDLLAGHARKTTGSSPNDLLAGARDHLVKVRAEYERNPMINVRLAEGMVDVFRKVSEEWDEIAPQARPWLLGAMSYFTSAEDEQPDMVSPIGFEDDCDVLNACLRLAQREDFCLNPEDYDDV